MQQHSLVDKMTSHLAHTLSSSPERDSGAGQRMTPQAAIPRGCPLVLLSTCDQHRCRTEQARQVRWPGRSRTLAVDLYSLDKYPLSSCYGPGAGLGARERSCDQDTELRAAVQQTLEQGVLSGKEMLTKLVWGTGKAS